MCILTVRDSCIDEVSTTDSSRFACIHEVNTGGAILQMQQRKTLPLTAMRYLQKFDLATHHKHGDRNNHDCKAAAKHAAGHIVENGRIVRHRLRLRLVSKETHGEIGRRAVNTGNQTRYELQFLI